MNNICIALIIVLGGLVLYSLNNQREGLSTSDAKTMGDNIKGYVKDQLVANGLPAEPPPEATALLDQLLNLMEQEVIIKTNTYDAIDANEESTPVLNTHEPVCPSKTFFTGNKFSSALCELSRGNPTKLNLECSALTANNCNATDCCIWVNGTKCVAGNADGPTYLTGMNSDADYYTHKYQCYGKC
jgi:hypothetical protein